MTDSPPLLRNLAVMVQLLTRGADAGLPLPTTCASATEYDIGFQWSDVGDLETWAEYLDVQTVESSSDVAQHVYAVTTVDGAPLRLAFFRRVEVAV